MQRLRLLQQNRRDDAIRIKMIEYKDEMYTFSRKGSLWTLSRKKGPE